LTLSIVVEIFEVRVVNPFLCSCNLRNTMEGGTLQIVLKTIRNELFPIEVDPSVSVTQLKQTIQSTTSIEADRQRLIYRGRILTDNSNVSDYGIENGNIVHVVARPANYVELQEAAARSDATVAASRLPNQPAIVLPSTMIANQLPAQAQVPVAQPPEEANSLEHVRQNLLTLNSIFSTMEPEDLRGFAHEYSQSSNDKVSAEKSNVVEGEDDEGVQKMPASSQFSAETETEENSAAVEVKGEIRFYSGQWVDVKDTVQQWLEATVLTVNHEEKKIYVHYNGW
jgi:hypothetical protein